MNEVPLELQYMNEPEKPYPPQESHKEFEERIIYTKTLIHEDADEDDIIESLYEEEKSDFNQDFEEIVKSLNIEGWGYKDDIFSLQKLLDLTLLLPKPQYDPKNIFVRVCRDRQIAYIQIQLIQKVPIDKQKQKEEYEKEYNEYIVKAKKYEKEMKIFKEWKKKKEIEECKEKLKQLEGE